MATRQFCKNLECSELPNVDPICRCNAKEALDWCKVIPPPIRFKNTPHRPILSDLGRIGALGAPAGTVRDTGNWGTIAPNEPENSPQDISSRNEFKNIVESAGGIVPHDPEPGRGRAAHAAGARFCQGFDASRLCRNAAQPLDDRPFTPGANAFLDQISIHQRSGFPATQAKGRKNTPPQSENHHPVGRPQGAFSIPPGIPKFHWEFT